MVFDDNLRGRYTHAAELTHELDRLRRMWMYPRPQPPLTRGALHLLGTLDRLEQHSDEPVTPGRLAKAMKQSPPGVSQRLRLVEEEGYVERAPASEDRRVTYLKLTDKGKEESRRALDTMLGTLEQAMDSLEADGAQELLRLLRRLNTSLEDLSAGQITDGGGDTTC